MNFFSIIGVELKKIRRSHIFWILLIPIVFLWIPQIINSDMNFGMQAEGIYPENNFFIQSFLGLAWFMYPATLVICTVLLNQTERSNKGILKMLSLPVNPAAICMAKFVVLLLLAAAQMIIMIGLYFPAAVIASQMNDYQLMISPLLVLRETGLIYLSSLPMAAFFWMVATCICTPVFSMGIGLASIVPSVLAMNTKIWFLYPMCYPFYMVAALQGEMAANLDTFTVKLVPWVPVAVGITAVCLIASCLFFGKSERRS